MKNWLNIAQQGKDSWNTWAEDELKKEPHLREEILFSDSLITINFEGYIFPSKVTFKNIVFNNRVSFLLTTFEMQAWFENCQFENLVEFRDSKFKSDCLFIMGCQFSGGVNFSQVKFSACVHFGQCIINKSAVFVRTMFEMEASFNGVDFQGDINFNQSHFKKKVKIENSKFSENVNFSEAIFASEFDATGTQFSRAVNFSKIHFLYPPNFITTEFKVSPSFLGAKFDYPTKESIWGRITGQCYCNDGYVRFLRLKKLAADAQDHERELQFFAMETKAKRSHLLKYNNPINWLPLLFIDIYECTSNFGQSVVRPFIGLLLVFFGSSYIFSRVPNPNLSFLNSNTLLLSGSNIVTIPGLGNIMRENAVKAICHPIELESCPYTNFLYSISAIEGLCTLIFFFLLVLGLRNFFRIK